MPTPGSQRSRLLSERIVRVGTGYVQITASGLVRAIWSSIRIHLV